MCWRSWRVSLCITIFPLYLSQILHFRLWWSFEQKLFFMSHISFFSLFYSVQTSYSTVYNLFIMNTSSFIGRKISSAQYRKLHHSALDYLSIKKKKKKRRWILVLFTVTYQIYVNAGYFKLAWLNAKAILNNVLSTHFPGNKFPYTIKKIC